MNSKTDLNKKFISFLEQTKDDKHKSVVNSDLKVHGVNNLYINWSSNFYRGGYTNPTFTIVQ